MSKKTEWYDRELTRLQGRLKDAYHYAELGLKENQQLKQLALSQDAEIKKLKTHIAELKETITILNTKK